MAERELLLFLLNIMLNGMNTIKTTTDEPEMAGITHIKNKTVRQHAPKCLKTHQV